MIYPLFFIEITYIWPQYLITLHYYILIHYINLKGPDAYHDAFKCTANGVYDTPSEEDDPPREWPRCQNQSDSKN